jgi:hypothetical protein
VPREWALVVWWELAGMGLGCFARAIATDQALPSLIVWFWRSADRDARGRRSARPQPAQPRHLAWIEGDYHRSIHREIGMSPLQRLRQVKSVGRPAPSVDALRDAFRLQQRRKQRRGDGTCSIEGGRFEIPSHYRHIETIYVRYARFDLSRKP